MRQFRFKLFVAGAIVLLALASRALVGQMIGEGRMQTEVQRSQVEPGLIAPAIRPGPAAEPPNVTQSLSFPRIATHVEGRQVFVSGKAEVFDRVPGNLYIWLLRIYSTGKGARLLREHHYLENAMQLADSGAASPTFDDAVWLDPGTYKVELTIYAVPADFPFPKVKFGEDLKYKAIAKLTRSKRVIVQ